MSFLRLNTESAFIPRLREIELAMQDYTVVNLRRIGAIAISFMVLEAFVIVPVLAFLLLRRISGIMVLRVSLLSVFLAVPRPIAAELAAQTVALAEFDDFETSIGETPPMGEQEGARGEHKGGRKDKAEGGGGGAEWHKVQQLMRTQIPRRKVRIARARLGADTVMENGGLRRRLFDGLPVLPLLLWAVLVVAIEAVTWQLQVGPWLCRLLCSPTLDCGCEVRTSGERDIFLSFSFFFSSWCMYLDPQASESQLQGPKFALTTLTHHAMALPEFSLELALAEASGEPTETLYTKREHLKQAVSAVEAAQEALLYGSSDLLGKRIDSGVLWRVKALQALHFDEGCLRTDGDCPSMEEDGDRWLARRGMYMLVVGLADEAERLAEDPVGAVTLHNERLRLLIELGVRELRYGCQER